MTPEEIAELITRRRRQLLVHSIIYYHMNDNIITDNQWAKWAIELEELQRDYPEIAKNCPRAKEFGLTKEMSILVIIRQLIVEVEQKKTVTREV